MFAACCSISATRCSPTIRCRSRSPSVRATLGVPMSAEQADDLADSNRRSSDDARRARPRPRSRCCGVEPALADPVRHGRRVGRAARREDQRRHARPAGVGAVPSRRARRCGRCTTTGSPIGVVSNTGWDVRTVFAAHSMAEFVTSFTLSYEAGAVKPDRRIFDAACALVETCAG